jgi:hypothetical protein
MSNILTPEQIALVASRAGFKGDNLVIAVAVALAESGGNALAHGDLQLAPYGSYGLWQINSHAHPDLIGLPADPSRWYDPFVNARFAYQVSGGSNWRPWSVFIHETYKSRMAAAKAGVDKYLANPAAVPNPKAVPPGTSVVVPYPNKVNLEVKKPYMRDGVKGITGIKKVQQRLIALGYSCGPDKDDGVYGPNTADAVTEWKKTVPSLKVPGVVGPDTWAALFKA